MKNYPPIEEISSQVLKCAELAAQCLENMHPLPYPDLRQPLIELYRNFFGWLVIKRLVEDPEDENYPELDEIRLLSSLARSFQAAGQQTIFKPYEGTSLAGPLDAGFRYSATATLSRAIADLIYKTTTSGNITDSAAYCALLQFGNLRKISEA